MSNQSSRGTARLDTLRNEWTITMNDGRTYTMRHENGLWKAYRGSRFIASYSSASVLRDRILGGWTY